jgi:hypothetical protein
MRIPKVIIPSFGGVLPKRPLPACRKKITMDGGHMRQLTTGPGTAQRRRAIVCSVLVISSLYLVDRSASVLPAARASGGEGRTYTTRFPLAENPISEGGNWMSGKKVGFDWTDVRTTPGFAFGTEVGGDRPALEKYDDSTALLTGSWGPNQAAQATVHRTNKDDDNVYQEVELRLRSSLSRHNATGYEVMFRCSKSTKAYCSLARWDGILGAWMMLKENTGSQYGVADGDVVKASIAGDTITVYINGVQVTQAHDYLFTSGNPGMGFYLEKAKGINDQCGFSSFTATDSEPSPFPISSTLRLNLVGTVFAGRQEAADR